MTIKTFNPLIHKADPTIDVLKLGKKALPEGITRDEIFSQLRMIGYDIPEEGDIPSWTTTTDFLYRRTLPFYFIHFKNSNGDWVYLLSEEGKMHLNYYLRHHEPFYLKALSWIVGILATVIGAIVIWRIERYFNIR